MKAILEIAFGASIGDRVADYFELTKPRLTLLAVAMTMLAFYLGANGAMPVGLACATLIGTALTGGGAAALNQYLERDADAKMHRTENRPLPTGRVLPAEALAFGMSCAVTGVLELFVAVNPLTALLAALCLASYLFVYTPLKRKTAWCTLIGALPGALPPLMGWTAVRGELGAGGWVLFGIVFLWQMPHFLAIGWMYQKDYARGDFRVLSVLDHDGRRTARQIALFSLALLPVSLAPVAFGLAGLVYSVGALVAGVAFLVLSLKFAATKSHSHARLLFLGSVIYLPVLGMLMIFAKA